MRLLVFLDSGSLVRFQSTHSLRSATRLVPTGGNRQGRFNPRTPCGVRLLSDVKTPVAVEFQSTHSLRSATSGAACTKTSSTSFNPRTPCGVRPDNGPVGVHLFLFQSTHSLRSATILSGNRWIRRRFQSTHSLRSATRLNVSLAGNGEFQSTHSLRSATAHAYFLQAARSVSIHALLAECDVKENPPPNRRNGFNPRTPCGVRHSWLSVRVWKP